MSKRLPILNLQEDGDWMHSLPGYEDEERITREALQAFSIVERGGPGSGHEGHKGRPGEVGGSLPSSRQPATITGPDGRAAIDNTKRLSKLFDDAHGTFHLDTSNEARKAVKKLVAEDLLHRVMGNPALHPFESVMVNAFIDQWAMTANGHEPFSLQIQQVAADKFDSPLSDWQKKRIASVLKDNDAPHLSAISLAGDSGIGALLDATYQNTQDMLAQNGFDPDGYVMLYRGARIVEPEEAIFGKGDIINYKGQTLESWSLDLPVARWFASERETDSRLFYDGMVLQTMVPVANIYSTAISGPGCLSEGEVIVFGNVPGQTARVLEYYYADDSEE